MLKLQAFTSEPPKDALSLLQALGTGEAGFGGTQFGSGEMTLDAYLKHTAGEVHRENLAADRVPQTTFWILEQDRAVGLLRMRHELNAATRIQGGHIGYYIRPDARQRGLATQALGLALQEIEALGVRRVMLTTNPSNLGSIRVIEENGGQLRAQIPTEDGQDTINQYWIELKP